MPAVVTPYNGPVGFALEAGAGAAAGVAAAGEIVEKKQEWDTDMEFRYQQLAEASRQNQLNRDQADKFNSMTDLRDRQMQTESLDAAMSRQHDEQTFTVNEVQPFDKMKEEMQLAEQNTENRRTTNATNWATQMRAKADDSQLDLERMKVVTQPGFLLDQARNALAGRDWEILTPEQQALAEDQMVQAILGEGREGKDPNQFPPTSEAIAKAHLQARTILPNFPMYHKDYIDGVTDFAYASGAARAIERGQGVGGAMGTDPKQNPFVTGKQVDKGFAQQFPGMPRLDKSPTGISPADSRIDDVIMDKILEAKESTMTYQQNHISTTTGLKAVQDSLNSEIYDLAAKQEWGTFKSRREYYANLVKFAISSASPDLVIDPNSEAARVPIAHGRLQ